MIKKYKLPGVVSVISQISFEVDSSCAECCIFPAYDGTWGTKSTKSECIENKRDYIEAIWEENCVAAWENPSRAQIVTFSNIF